MVRIASDHKSIETDAFKWVINPYDEFAVEAALRLKEKHGGTVTVDRPDDCRSYPHLDKEGFVLRLTQAFSNCSICPVVYNVYHELMRRLWKSS